MHHARRSSLLWRVSCFVLASCGGLLGGPNLLLGIGPFMVVFPGSTSHSHASAGVAMRGGGRGYPLDGHGAVGVNDGLLIAGSVHFGEDVPVPNLCVELRGYLAGERPDETCAFRDGGAAGCSGWWDPSLAPPKFRQLHRTDDPGGSFAFVTPASGMVLMLAEYSHGGDYPTSVRFLQHQHPRTDDGLTSGGRAQTRLQHRPTGDGSTFGGAHDRRHEMYGAESGRLEVRINLSERTDITPEVLMWSTAARENDHSPCALENAANVNDNAFNSVKDDAVNGGDSSAKIWAGTRVVPLSVSGTSSALRDVPSWVNRHDDMMGGNMPAESATIGNRLSAREGVDDGRETSPTSLQLAALLRSSCLNYGQQRAGQWEENAAVCGIFRSLLETEHAHENVLQNIIQNIVQNVLQNILQILVVLMEHVRTNVGIRGIVQAVVAFGGMLFLLSKLLSCLVGVSSCSSDDGYGHISSACSASGSLESLNDPMAGVFDNSTGGVLQLASAGPRPLDAMTENRKNDIWGRPTRVVADTTRDGNNEFDAFSSMFSTLDDEMSSLSVASNEVGRVAPRQSWTRGSYVVFEQ